MGRTEQKIRRVPTEFYLCASIGEAREIVDKTLKMISTQEALEKDKESVSQSRLGFESQLHKGNVLAPLTFMVFHRNHLGCLRT